MYKKKVLFQSNYHTQLTGFGKNCKNVLSALFETGKYEIVELANGINDNDPNLSFSPWKTIGMTPTNEQVLREFILKFPEDQRQKDVHKKRIFYGDASIDKVIADEKPDFYINVEDIWASVGYTQKEWWNKFPCMIWTTLDSLPIIQDAIVAAPKIKHYYSWASFATKDLNLRGQKHVKTLHGAVKYDDFFRLPDEERISNRLSHGIDREYIVGFVFRNQLRKSVPNFLEGMSIFKKQNPKIKIKGLFVTNYAEGWDIRREILQKGLELADVLTAYVCNKCQNYQIKPCLEHQIDCKACGGSKTCNTVNVNYGLSEEQLNEVYNLMDVYCHPFTSGGQEIPLQEAKSAELITLTTNYSCGTDSCSEESAGIPLEWDSYSEIGSQFIKATTRPKSIAENLLKVYQMTDIERREIGKKARKYVIDNYSVEVISNKLQEIVDSVPDSRKYWDSLVVLSTNPDFIPDDSLDDVKWLESIYHKMLGDPNPKNDPNFQICLDSLSQGETRENALFQFRMESENRKNSKKTLVESLPLTKEDRAAIVINGNREQAFKALQFCMSSEKKCCVFCDKKWFDTFYGQNIKLFERTTETTTRNFYQNNFSHVETF